MLPPPTSKPSMAVGHDRSSPCRDAVRRIRYVKEISGPRLSILIAPVGIAGADDGGPPERGPLTKAAGCFCAFTMTAHGRLQPSPLDSMLEATRRPLLRVFRTYPLAMLHCRGGTADDPKATFVESNWLPD